MKKLMIALCAAVMGASVANAGDFFWSWWVKAPAEVATKDVKGCVLGFASETASIQGAQVSLCWNQTEKVNGGAQVAIGYNNATAVKNGPQIAFVNVSDAAALQFGLLNFNKAGFLPFFPFFNFATTQFGSQAK